MHIDARNIEESKTLRSEICVVGAGAAGITLARQLAGTSTEVCLLESGGLDAPGDAQDLYRGKNVGLPYLPLNSCRLRYFGGTTNHWAGWCSPLDPIDFEERPWIPHSGWPISRADLESYYRDAQQVCQLGPYKYDLEHWRKDISEEALLFDNVSPIANRVIQLSPPTRFGDTYREDLLSSDNITLVTHASVTEIDTPPSASTVSRLQVECLKGHSFQVEARRYVLACGGIENPRLLLLSDQYAPNGLGNQNDLVGRFFMDHPRAPTARAMFARRESLLPYGNRAELSDADKQAVLRPTLTPHVQRSRNLVNAGFEFELESAGYLSARRLFRKLRAKKLRFGSQHTQLSDAVSNVMMDFEGVVRGVNDALRGAPPWEDGFKTIDIVTRWEQIPNPESRVQLGRERDALGQRRVQLNWQLTDREWKALRPLNTLLARQLGSTGRGRLRLHEWIRKEPASWPPTLEGGWHHIGTTRMGSTPQEGVCDRNCKVFGIDNLYLAGSSVFPTSGTVPPTLTIVALSLRLGDHLRGLPQTTH